MSVRARLVAGVAVVLALVPAVASAHPHVFIDYSIVFLVGARGPESVRIEWAFDELYSSMLLQRYDTDRNGVLSPREVQMISSYFVARDARVGTGIVVGSLVSFLQAASSIALVALVALVLGHQGLDVLDHSVWLEVVGYGVIAVIGLAIVAGALRHRHGHQGAAMAGGRHLGAGMIIGAGLTPCVSAVTVLLFALANGVLLVGIAATVVMAIGMSLTVSLAGIAAILGRRALLLGARSRPRVRGWLATGLEVAGGLMVAVIGGLFMAGAWQRLG